MIGNVKELRRLLEAYQEGLGGTLESPTATYHDLAVALVDAAPQILEAIEDAMNVWLVHASNLPNDPYSYIPAVFSDEQKAQDYIEQVGKPWWSIEAMSVDEPE